MQIARGDEARPGDLLDELSLGLAPIIVERLLPAVRMAADDHGTAVLLVERYLGTLTG